MTQFTMNGHMLSRDVLKITMISELGVAKGVIIDCLHNYSTRIMAICKCSDGMYTPVDIDYLKSAMAKYEDFTFSDMICQ